MHAMQGLRTQRKTRKTACIKSYTMHAMQGPKLGSQEKENMF